MTHDELQNDLAAHLRGGTDRMVWTNTQMGPVGSPRPDVFTAACSFANPRFDAYEVKVSKSDMRSDLTKGKWQSYRPFSHAVWFAFKKDLVPHDLIPKECGIIVRSDKGWRAVRKPVSQVLDTLPRNAWMKLLLTPPTKSAEPTARHGNLYMLQQASRKKFGDDIARIMNDRHSAEHMFERETERLRNHADQLRAQMQMAEKTERDRRQYAELRLNAAQQSLAQALGLVDYGGCTVEDLTGAINSLKQAFQSLDIEGPLKALQKIAAVVGAEKQKNIAVRQEKTA